MAKAKRKAKRGLKESTLPPGEAGRILDKIVLLEKVIGPGDILQALHDADCLDARRCRLTRAVTFWIVLVMALAPELPVRQVFRLARRRNTDQWTPTRAALCVARRRLGPRRRYSRDRRCR